jgi:hypothetical protein
MGPGAGPEPRCALESQTLLASAFFDLMTKFTGDRMNETDLALVHKVMRGGYEDERVQIDADPTYGTAARFLVQRIRDRTELLERRRQN